MMTFFLRLSRFVLFVWLLLAAIPLLAAASTAQSASSGPVIKPARLIVLTDIGAEADDTESTVRLLLYSDVIDIKGLIATTSIWHAAPSPELIRDVIDAYAKVQGNLVKHDPKFPRAEALQSVVKHGIAAYGMTGVGIGKDSEGSDWIIHTLDEPDNRPLWIAAWGGVNTLAQALYKIRATRSPEDLARMVAKLRVYTISDQDDAGPWIRKNFPKLFYIVSPGGEYSQGTWGGMNAFIPGIDNSTISNKWLAEHIQQGHGPLGAAYPDVAYGMEGDTPSWLNLIPNGLNNPEHPGWGGWGGRYEFYQPKIAITDPKTFLGGVPIEQETRPIWTNATDSYTPPAMGEYGRAILPGSKTYRGFKETIWRWRDDFQNDFAARMEWTTKSFQEANHPPVVTLDQPAAITVRSGSHFALRAHATDPDGDSLTYYWFQYPEAGTYKGLIEMGATDMPGVYLTAPRVDQPETMHFIVRVTDKGTPPLSRYQRVIVTVTP
ncbi:MAG: nucleoside hydrolase-like domain-containing protein [Acidobacteriaceae bacterium]